MIDTWELIQLSISDSRHTLIDGDNLIGFGKSPWETLSHIVLLAKVVFSVTPAIRSNFLLLSMWTP